VKLIVFRKNYPNRKDSLRLAFFINAILSKQYNLSDLGTVSRAKMAGLAPPLKKGVGGI
jgi:hypothetical protein